MSDFLRSLFLTSLSGAVVAALFLALKPLADKRLPKMFQYCAWLVIMLHLLLPVSLSITVPERVAVPVATTTASPVVTSTTAPAGDTTSPAVLAGPPAAPAQPGRQTTVPAAVEGRRAWSVSVLLLTIWGMGVATSIVCAVAGYGRFRRIICRTAVPVTDNRLLAVLQACRQETRVRITPTLYASSFIASPLLLGVFHPVIVVPDCRLTDSDLRYALLHELTHVRRYDGLFKWLTVLAVSIHWFNPLAYVLQREVNRSCELACDEAATMKLSTDERRGYGTMLLSIASAAAVSSPITFSAMVGDKQNLKERIGVIMFSKLPTRRSVVVSIIVVVLIAAIATLAGCTFVTSQHYPMRQPAPLSDLRMITGQAGWALTVDDRILRTTDGGATWTDVSVAAILQTEATSSYVPVGACFLDEERAFVVASNRSETDLRVTVYRTGDRARTWTSTPLPVSVDWEREDIGSMFIDFIDDSRGYVMVTSTPGLGQMGKLLYKTSDGGASYSFVGDITGMTDEHGVRSGIEGYPTGMAFSSETVGFVTCSYHGQADPQIYKTADGGLTWVLAYQHIPKAGETYVLSFPAGQIPDTEEDEGYIDAYTPLFAGMQRTDGVMLLDLVRDETHLLQLYRTDDGGATWSLAGIMGNKDIRRCSFVDGKTGYGIDSAGVLFTTGDGGLHWAAVSSTEQ